jgi:hypothetical protein
MDHLYKCHRELSNDDFKKLWENALFIFDTNSLLDIYRLPETAKKDFLSSLLNEKIKSKVWIPFQVLLEFTSNRLEVVSDQKNKFTSVQNIVNESLDELSKVHIDLIEKINSLQLKKRHSVINPDQFINDNLFKESIEKLNKFINELEKLEKKQPDVHDKDEIRSTVLKIFKEKVSNGFTTEELENIYKEGELRYKDEIPPGYKDSKKPGFYLYEDKKYLRKFGDLIVWKEIIKKAVDDNEKYIIFVTNDNKDDWWAKQRGKTLGPRYELLNEIYFKAQKLELFHMYDTYGFMKYSKQYLDIDIKEQSITETKDLIDFQQTLQKEKNITDITDFKELIKKIASQFPLKIRFHSWSEKIPFLLISKNELRYIFIEILENIYEHSLNKSVTIRLKLEGDYFTLQFKNECENNKTGMLKRNNGLNYVDQIMNSYGFSEHKTIDNQFITKLYFKKTFMLDTDVLPYLET